MFKETMAKNSLSALDFIINVLREHEKELTELSERLENTLAVVTGDSIKQTLNELSSSVQVLSQAIDILSEKVDSQSNADVHFRDTLKNIREESQKQKTQVHNILNQLKTFPTKDDVQNLRKAIDTLGSLLNEKDQKSTGVYEA